MVNGSRSASFSGLLKVAEGTKVIRFERLAVELATPDQGAAEHALCNDGPCSSPLFPITNAHGHNLPGPSTSEKATRFDDRPVGRASTEFRSTDVLFRTLAPGLDNAKVEAMALEPRAGASQLTQVSSTPWTARLVNTAGCVQLALGVILIGWAVVDPPLRAPPLIGLGGAAIVNGTGYLLGVPPGNLRLTLASVACIALGMLSLLL